MTIIRTCTCKSEFQDTTYGKQKRVFNKLEDFVKSSRARCTVCGKESTK
jgi:hypothetical protein